MPTMPNVVGLNLQEAQLALQQAGVLVPASLSYFSDWPVTAIWRSGGLPGIAQSQSPNSGAQVAVNASVTLTLGQYPMGISFA